MAANSDTQEILRLSGQMEALDVPLVAAWMIAANKGLDTERSTAEVFDADDPFGYVRATNRAIDQKRVVRQGADL